MKSLWEFVCGLAVIGFWVFLAYWFYHAMTTPLPDTPETWGDLAPEYG